MTTRWCVLIRNGGTDRCWWTRSTPCATRAAANTLADAVRTGGRKALVADFDQSLRLGLPEGWTAD